MGDLELASDRVAVEVLLVNQAVRDCLEEAMDFAGFERLLLALIGMATNVIPFLGPYLAVIPAIIIALVSVHVAELRERLAVPGELAPENILKSSGRGIFFMRSFMDDVVLRRASEGAKHLPD